MQNDEKSVNLCEQTQRYHKGVRQLNFVQVYM